MRCGPRAAARRARPPLPQSAALALAATCLLTWRAWNPCRLVHLSIPLSAMSVLTYLGRTITLAQVGLGQEALAYVMQYCMPPRSHGALDSCTRPAVSRRRRLES